MPALELDFPKKSPDGSIAMPWTTEEGVNQLSEPVLEYGCTPWKTSSQQASDLYEAGIKLWRKEDLIDIEQQLAQSLTAEKFTVRRLDGSLVHIKNPMFGVQKPIWKPAIKFQEYWRLVQKTSGVRSELYNCTYFVEWFNQTLRNYEGPVENANLLFESARQKWNASATCEALISQLRKLLGGDGNAKKVTKIVCFGLGDINFKPPDWWRMENNSKPEREREPETAEGAFIHHAIALTIADIARSYKAAEDSGVRLLTQDPDYSDETKDILQKFGFEVVGEYGAGGFAELDDESIAFSPFVAAPVKQIIADFARPVAVVCCGITGISGVYNQSKGPRADPESPRTRKMWSEYENSEFPVVSPYPGLERHLNQLEIFARIGK